MGRPADCTIRTGCKATTKAGVVKPHGQVCRKDSRQSGRTEGTPLQLSINSCWLVVKLGFCWMASTCFAAIMNNNS